MPKIPLYQQQQQASQEYGAAQLDLSPEIRAVKEIANIKNQGEANLVKGIQQLDNNMKKLKTESDIADADVLSLQFGTELEQAKADFLEGGGAFSDIEKEVIIPQQKAFASKLEEKGYSNSASRLIIPKIQADFQNQIQTQRINVIEYNTKQHVSKIGKAAQLQILSADTSSTDELLRASALEVYNNGVNEINGMVTSNYITQEQADELISTANESYFKRKIETVTSKEDIANLQLDGRWSEMSGTTQRSLLIEARDNYFEYHKETVADNITKIEALIEDGKFTTDQLEVADIPDEYKPGLRTQIELNEENATAEFYETEDTDIDLEEIDTKIKKLLNGEYGQKGGDQFITIFNDITSSKDLPSTLKASRVDMLIDFTKSQNGFNAFIMNKGGAGYTADVKWLWDTYWTTYEDAITNMPAERRGRDFNEALTNFAQFIKDQKHAGGRIPEDTSYDTRSRIRHKQALADYEEVRKKLGEDTGILEQNDKGQIVAGEHNRQVINKWMNNQFSEYLKYRSKKYFNKRLGIFTPMGAETTFSVYKDPVLELKRQGVIE